MYEMLDGKPLFNFENINVKIDDFKKPLNLPNNFSEEAKDLITKLLNIDPKKRIGAGPNGIEDLKKHKYFKRIDQKNLENKDITPPFIPNVEGPTDLKYFDKIFTDEVNISRDGGDGLNEGNKSIDNYVNFSYYDQNNTSFKDNKDEVNNKNQNQNQ